MNCSTFSNSVLESYDRGNISGRAFWMKTLQLDIEIACYRPRYDLILFPLSRDFRVAGAANTLHDTCMNLLLVNFVKD